MSDHTRFFPLQQSTCQAKIHRYVMEIEACYYNQDKKENVALTRVNFRVPHGVSRILIEAIKLLPRLVLLFNERRVISIYHSTLLCG